ncbi:MAG: hypothetical protein JNM67_06505 [Bacteroidetes bacterium]|nr:hypothetical protein [Bacteroidota bacterium]
MNIKIPPYPNYQITDQAFDRDVVLNSVVKNDSSDLTSNKLLLTVVFKTGEKRVIRARSVKLKDDIYVTAFPNPVHLFLSAAIEHFNNSEQVKENNFPKCGKKQADNLYILDIEKNGTHECYNFYVKYRASSIIMLVSALEAFLNHIIPNDFIYKTTRDNKPKEYNKADIESTKVWFSDKLIKVIPQCLGKDKFWDNLTKEKDIILALYENRKNIIHLKTNAEDDLTRYFDVIDKMLDFDILSSINATISFMNSASDKFIEFESD